MDIEDSQPEAGPSRSVAPQSGKAAEPPEGYITIPSYGKSVRLMLHGLDYFEYRRAIFLATPADQPLPLPPAATPSSLHETHVVPVPPPPLPPRPGRTKAGGNAAIERIETLLAHPGAEEDDLAWKAGVEGVARSLTAGKRLSTPMRLGLVIKILRATWLRDGTWPTDPRTSRAVLPPDSPLMQDDTPLPSEHAGVDTPPLPGLAGLMGYHGTPASGYIDLPPAAKRSGSVTAVRQSRPAGIREGAVGEGDEDVPM